MLFTCGIGRILQDTAGYNTYLHLLRTGLSACPISLLSACSVGKQLDIQALLPEIVLQLKEYIRTDAGECLMPVFSYQLWQRPENSFPLAHVYTLSVGESVTILYQLHAMFTSCCTAYFHVIALKWQHNLSQSMASRVLCYFLESSNHAQPMLCPGLLLHAMQVTHR